MANAATQIKGIISLSSFIIAGDQRVTSFKTIKDFHGYDSSFPKNEYVIDPIIINYKNKDGHYQSILGKGTLTLINYYPNNGNFNFKLTINQLSFSQSRYPAWAKSKNDIPIKNASVYFDNDHNNFSTITGKYNATTKEFIPQKNSFFITKGSGYAIVLDREKDIPVTINVDSFV
jgi:hypothetical protein